MPSPTSINELLDLTRKSGIVDESRLNAYVQQLRDQNVLPNEPPRLAGAMVRDGILTYFQAEQLLLGKWKRFSIGKYKVLEKLGSGGMGQVFLCEHKMMRRRVAIKVLPTAKADDPSSLERFYREARVIGTLNHPNIVKAHDIDQDDNLHFLVMEFVDGGSFQEIVKRFGPMDPIRACHYMYQSAHGLQHAFDAAGIIHRDIKPGNILVDRTGLVKILDMGLARFFHDDNDLLTRQYDETVLGTADYLAPEQAIDSHTVDIRADIYSLGATFYFLLTANPPFTEGTVAQKLIWHQTREPKPIKSIRPDVPDSIVAIVQKMMAKDANARYQSPNEVAEALLPYVGTPIPPPPEEEMPRLSVAAMGNVATTAPTGPPTRVLGPNSPAPARTASQPDVVVPPVQPMATPAPMAQPSSGRAPQTPRPAAAPLPPAPPPRTAPAPAAPRVATIEESPVWANIASETPKPKPAHSDTERTPAYKPPTATMQAVRPRVASKKPAMRWVLLVVAGLLVGAVVVGAALAFGVFGGRKSSDTKQGSAQQNSPQTLVVDSAAPADNVVSFPRVLAALRKAKSGDKIVVRSSAVEEEWSNVDLSTVPRDITIEAEASGSTLIPWRLPVKASDTKAVLYLANAQDLRFRGFLFDGQNRVEVGVYVTSRSPGLSFENCRVQNCLDSGIKLTNAAGDADRPISFRRVRVGGLPVSKAAVTLFCSTSIQTIRANSNVVFHSCIFEGPAPALIVVDGSVSHATIENCRFFNATDGLFVKQLRETQWCRLTLKSNTFHRMARNAIGFAGPWPDKGTEPSSLALTGTIFSACKEAVNVNGAKPIPGLDAKLNVRDNSTAAGNINVPMTAADVKWVSEDPNDERNFLSPTDAKFSNPPLGPAGSRGN